MLNGSLQISTIDLHDIIEHALIFKRLLKKSSLLSKSKTNFFGFGCLKTSNGSFHFVSACLTHKVKVRPLRQQFSHTTLYNKVVRHKTCRDHAKSCCATNVHISTIFFINLAWLQRKKWQKYVQITSDSTQNLCETIMSHEFLLK